LVDMKKWKKGRIKRKKLKCGKSDNNYIVAGP
jgi:hypothetical protein